LQINIKSIKTSKLNKSNYKHSKYTIQKQWAAWDGLRKFEAEKHDYLQGQIGNPEGEDKPNKKVRYIYCSR
jgi:hypothetical protein